MKCEIRHPLKEELNEIEELFGLTVYDNFMKEGIQADSSDEIESLKEGIRIFFELGKTENIFLVAIVKDKIVGTIAYGKPNTIIEENLTLDFTNTPEVKSVYILPNFQNKGIGTMLFRSILLELKNNNIDHFCLDSGYKRAQSYWSKILGEPICKLNDYWNKGSHHLIWHCEVETVLKLISNRF